MNTLDPTGRTPEAAVTTRCQTLRAQGRLRILHISDLHVREKTRFTERPWQPLENYVAELQPDLIVATGDIADNPFGEFLANQRRTRLTRVGISWKVSRVHWNELLEGVLGRSREYLERLCRTAGLDPLERLRVIPGNHDYRAQGLFGGRELAAEIFRKVFAGVRDDIDLDWQDTSAGPATFRTRIFCLDSNGPDEFSNFAAGRIEDDELSRVPRLNGSPGALDEFRIVLMHHHPMPIAALEFTRKSFWQRLRGVTEDDRFLMLRNAGTVMRHLTAAGVHLVLHGHRHHRGYAQVAFPQMSDGEQGSHRMTVVAAGSLGMGPAGTHHFNMVNIYPPGGIQVEEWKLEGVNFEQQPVRVLVDEESLRNERWKQARARHAAAASALADVIQERIEVTSAGDGFYRRIYQGLRPKEGALSLERIPFAFTSNSGYLHPTQSPQVRVLSGGDDRTGRFERELDAGHDTQQTDVKAYRGVKGHLVFQPPVPANRHIDVEVNFVVANAYEVIREFMLAREPYCEGNEHIQYNARRVPCEKLILVVKRPMELDALGCDWGARVLGPEKKDDWRERRSSSIQTCAVEGRGLFLMAIRYPLSGYDYRVWWRLPSLSDVRRKLTRKASFEESRLRTALGLPENRPKIAAALLRTRNALQAEMDHHFHDVKFDSGTVLAFFRFDSKEMRLTRVTDSANDSREWILDSGQAIPGQALRRCAPITYSPHGGDNDTYYYEAPPYLEPPGHRFQMAIPLPYPPVFEREKSYPILGVLTLETVADDPSLVSLISGGEETDPDSVQENAAVQTARGAVSSWTIKCFVREFMEEIKPKPGLQSAPKVPSEL